MAERIVVGFLTQVGSVSPESADVYAGRLVELRKKAEALGGRLCALGSQSVAFDFAVDDLEEAISLATSARESEPAEAAGLNPWHVAIAQGEMTPMAEAGSLALPSWGPPLVTAIALARIARPGEVLIDPATPGVVTGEVLTSGSRAGKEGARKIRGLLIDKRQAFRRDAAEKNLAHLSRPPFVARHAALGELLATHAPLGLIRAEPGLGGTRLLEEIESALSPGRSLHLCTAGAEPLGALRRAFARSIASGGLPSENALTGAQRRSLDELLAGDGISLDLAAELVKKWVTLRDGSGDGQPRSNGAVLVDDAVEVDDPSLDAVGRAARLERGAFRVIVRLDASAPLPHCLDGLQVGATVTLAPLARASAEELATSIVHGQLSIEAAKRWARRGRYTPLGVGEAIAEGLTTGELAWGEGGAVPRNRNAGLKLQLGPEEWILRRLHFVPEAAKQALRAVAVLGIEVTLPRVHELIAMAKSDVGDAVDHIAELGRGGWLRTKPEGLVALPSRTHREVILGELSDESRAEWHELASRVVEKLGGRLGSAEAARHAVLAGNHGRAVDLALVAARASHQLGLDAATEALLAFAGATHDDLAPKEPAPGFRLDTWIEALRASGDREGAAIRLEAIAALAKGETNQALAVLRAGVATAESAAPAARSRASLAYGIALAVAGRQTEALIAALEALARAREGGETRGEQACTRFLARLSGAAGHAEAAKSWLTVAGEIPS
jgi:hypothetical protein